MEIAWQRILPVIVSMIVIIVVAVLRESSRTLAAIMSTMPINITLALWIVSSSGDNSPVARVQFANGLLTGILSTVVFVIAIVLATRAGLDFLPTLAVGYICWGVALLALLGARQLLGF